MIEFLQPLLDAVTKAVPAMSAKREREESARLGTELFLVYVQLNEALVLAEEIILALETYTERMSEHLRTGGDKYALTAGSWVSDKVEQQLRNLVGVRDRLARWRFEFQVLDGTATNELRFQLDIKHSALRALAAAIDSGRVPLRQAGVLIDDGGSITVPPGGRPSDLGPVCTRLHGELMADSLAMDAPWGPEALARVQDYLAGGLPRQRLDAIRASMEQIRAALEANFTLSDVLLRVGDRRAGRSWRV